MASRAREFRFSVDLTPGGELRDENGVRLAVPAEWTPEHLLLAALGRCSLASLQYHAKRAELARQSRVRLDTRARHATRGPRPLRRRRGGGRDRRRHRAGAGPNELADLLAKAERDCFVGASLTVKPRYRWTVNGAIT